MKTLKLIALAAFALLFSQCKTTAPTAPSGPAPSLLEVQKILVATNAKFLQYADSTNSNPWKAIMLTTNWVKSQPNVASVESLDSTYISITLKSGLTSMFSFDLVDDSGRSILKGGGKEVKGEHISVSGTHSKNTITNKKVLIFSAGNLDFYKNNEIQKTVDIFNNSSLGLDVTLLVDEQCTPAIVDHFGDYGLVIIDSHGSPNTFMSGTILDFTPDKTEDEIDQAIIDQQGQYLYDGLINNDYGMWYLRTLNNVPDWQKRVGHFVARVDVTTKHIDHLPSMPGTVIMGSMCYSGYQNSLPNGYTPMKTAFMNKNPISYYAFSYDDGTSAPVNAVFAKKMEDSLADALVIDLDSTKTANLKPDHLTEYFDPTITVRNLWFKHFGADDYSYYKCGDTLIDSRDGQKYPTVCIGKQNWMAQNLNYNAPGSATYNNDPANSAIYGRLYDWKTLMQGSDSSKANPSAVRGVCPKGWHIPSDAEFSDLFTYLTSTVGFPNAGGALKSISPLWNSPNVGATNSTGFNGLPGGLSIYISDPAGFINIGTEAVFATTTNIDNAWSIWQVVSDGADIQGSKGLFDRWAVSCRCVKDQ